MKRWLKRVTLAGLVVLVVIQLFRPAQTNPSTDPMRELHASMPVSPAAGAVLSRSCNDCHSNRTVWPWYSQVAPASWLVVSDVNRGRAALNFSEWAGYNDEVRQKHLAEVCKEVKEGEMPGLAYTLIHRKAKLSAADVAAICQWTQSSGPSFSAMEAK